MRARFRTRGGRFWARGEGRKHRKNSLFFGASPNAISRFSKAILKSKSGQFCACAKTWQLRQNTVIAFPQMPSSDPQNTSNIWISTTKSSNYFEYLVTSKGRCQE
jgi:hypothetical protein